MNKGCCFFSFPPVQKAKCDFQGADCLLGTETTVSERAQTHPHPQMLHPPFRFILFHLALFHFSQERKNAVLLKLGALHIYFIESSKIKQEYDSTREEESSWMLGVCPPPAVHRSLPSFRPAACGSDAPLCAIGTSPPSPQPALTFHDLSLSSSLTQCVCVRILIYVALESGI